MKRQSITIAVRTTLRTYRSFRTDERELIREESRITTYRLPVKLYVRHPLHIALSIHRAGGDE